MCNSCKTCIFGKNITKMMFYYCEIGEQTCENGICSRHTKKNIINKMVKPISRRLYRRLNKCH